MKMKVFICYSTAGEGHKKIAEAIEEELKTHPDLFSVLGFNAFDYVGDLFRESYPAVYFYAVKYIPKLWGILYEATDCPVVNRFVRPLRSLWNRIQSKKLREFVIREKPDLIISTHFFAAEVLASSKKRGEISSQLMTVITDVMPHSFWMNNGTDLYWVMAEESKQALLKRKISENQIKVGGIPIKKEFTREEDKSELLCKLGIMPERFNILFSSGSFGIGPTKKWLGEVNEFGSQLQVLVGCGKNRTLYESLENQKYSFPIILMGFVNNMHELMSVSDLLIAKSGGATTCESLAKNLPMLISAPIPGQETRNAEWLLRHQASYEIKFPGELKKLLAMILNNPGFLLTMKENIHAIAKPKASKDLVNYVISSHDRK